MGSDAQFETTPAAFSGTVVTLTPGQALPRRQKPPSGGLFWQPLTGVALDDAFDARNSLATLAPSANATGYLSASVHHPIGLAMARLHESGVGPRTPRTGLPGQGHARLARARRTPLIDACGGWQC